MRSALIGLVCFVLASPVWAADIVLQRCLLSVDQEAQVPAQEGGELLKLNVREGQQVQAGDLLAQIDDAQPKAQYDTAVGKLKVAEKQATDDVSVKYARAGAQVAALELEKNQQANAKTPGTVPEIEIERLRFKKVEMVLSIEKALKEMAVAALQVEVAKAEMRTAAVSVKHRQVIAPLNGVVVELSRHEGEWVQPGETVMRLVRVDRLRVEGFLNAKEYDQAEICDRPVTVTVRLPHGQVVTVPGKVTYVRPLVETGDQFLIRAEVQNRVSPNGAWVLTPGLMAEMKIELK
jgi:multidrug efflux pump subunit AcrA (membrane-fusion protein)